MNSKKQIKRIYNFVVILLLAAAIVYTVSRVAHWGSYEYTDDAQVQRHITPINTRIQGFIKEIRFEEYSHVNKGDTLVIIEDTEYRLQLAQAEASLLGAESGSQAISAGISTTASNVRVATAGIEEARVNMENAKRDFDRYAQLLKNEAVTRQQYEAVRTGYEAARARYEQALASRNSTSLVKNEQAQRLSQNAASVAVAEAAMELARLNLSYTVIVATTDGTIGRKDIHEGQLVQPGQLLARIVDDNQVWVIANYRETQMKHISVGSNVHFTADALPDIKYSGVVESISPATGSGYSTVAADNATGNFVKVEQRIPVRIKIETSQDNVTKLIAGLNVETEVDY